MPKKTYRNYKVQIPPGAVIYGRVIQTSVGGTPAINVHGMGGPMTSLTAKKGSIEVTLPPATIVGISPSDKYVAWDGEYYVLKPTLESIRETDHLTLIGMVNDPKATAQTSSSVAQKSKADRTINVRREARKLNTLAVYKSWHKEFKRLKKEHPNMSDAGCARIIAGMDIGKERSVDTIRKHMKA